MFVVGNTGDDVNEYTLTTGFDVSTASFVGSFLVSAQEAAVAGLAFSADGTKMFVIGTRGDDVNEYTLTTGFELINTAPTLSSSTPADGATGVAVDANIVLTFSEAVDVESGNIVIKKSSDDSTVETIDVTGSLVTGTGTTEITINPSTTLTGSTNYYITIAATAFDDDSSNSYAGITDSTTLNFTTVATNLPSPLDKKDVIGSIEAWNDISSEWIKFSIDNAFNRIDWLNRQRGSNQTSHQGIKLSFVNTLIDKIMNNSPGAALRDIDVVDTTASLIGSTNATLDEVSDNAESKANDIAINEAVRLREALIGSLNPSFGPVSGDWSMWTEGRIVIGKTDASTTASKKEIDVQAISLGIDRPVGDGDELMGFVLSIGQDDTDIGTASTNVKSDNYSLSN
jgi:methionine-rich copper-binding protein CopC